MQPIYSQESSIRVLRSVNVMTSGMNSTRQEFVDLNFYNSNKRGQVQYDDVLLTSTGVGTLGRCSIVKTKDKIFVDGHITIIRNLNKISPDFLYVYLNTKYGQKQIDILYKGSSGQIEIYPSDIGQIYIKDFSFQEGISQMVNLSFEYQEKSKVLYQEAEEILLKELDLLNFEPKEENISVVSFSESFGKSGRLDSEYYDPKYQNILDKIQGYKYGCKFLKDITSFNTSNFYPKVEEYYKYIELSNVDNYGSILEVLEKKGEELPTRARRKIKEGDLIISSIEGSLSSCALIPPCLDNQICSTGFFVITQSLIGKEALLLLFKTVLIHLMKRLCSGTILTSIDFNSLKEVQIPLLPLEIQNQIEEKIQESFRLREESQNLLTLAKEKVERAIETGEL